MPVDVGAGKILVFVGTVDAKNPEANEGERVASSYRSFVSV